VHGDIRETTSFRVGVFFLYLFTNLRSIIIINKFINIYIYSKEIAVCCNGQFDINGVNVM